MSAVAVAVAVSCSAVLKYAWLPSADRFDANGIPGPELPNDASEAAFPPSGPLDTRTSDPSRLTKTSWLSSMSSAVSLEVEVIMTACASGSMPAYCDDGDAPDVPGPCDSSRVWPPTRS